MNSKEEQFRRRLMATFLAEAEEYISEIISGLSLLTESLDIADADKASVVERVFRQFHSLKGSSQAIGFDEIGRSCQNAENILSVWKKDHNKINQKDISKVIDAALSAASELNITPNAVQPPEAAPKKPEAQKNTEAEFESKTQSKKEELPKQPEQKTAAGKQISGSAYKVAGSSSPPIIQKQETLRISADKLDLLLRRGEQLVLARVNSKERVTESQKMLSDFSMVRRLIQEQLSKMEETPILLTISDQLHQLYVQFQRHARNLNSDYHDLNHQLQFLLNEVKSTRLAPVKSLLEELEITARRAARQLGKRVRISVSGTELELDRSIMENLKEPLMHLVRNALDHGLESSEERQMKDKPQEGHLSIDVTSKGIGTMEFSVSDDGRGIKTDEVLAAAKQQGLIAEGAEVNYLDLIFTSGISTKAEANEISGRGLGLAIVHDKVTSLKGNIRIQTNIGEGTTFILSIPTSLATFEGLLIQEKEQLFIFPINDIEAVTVIKTKDISIVEGNRVFIFRNKPVPVAKLGQILKIDNRTDAEEKEEYHGVIITAGGRRLAVLVDQIIDTREVLSRNLGPQLRKVRFIMGACMVGYRQVVPVLNATDLITHIKSSAKNVQKTSKNKPKSILVADDSLTTRTLVRSILEGAGYTVRLAADGMQAWEIMQNDTFSMLISDVDMPEMTGFDLTIKVRANSRLARMPIILITGQERPEDKNRGLRLGANAYITKNSFEKGILLNAVSRFIGDSKTSK